MPAGLYALFIALGLFFLALSPLVASYQRVSIPVAPILAAVCFLVSAILATPGLG